MTLFDISRRVCLFACFRSFASSQFSLKTVKSARCVSFLFFGIPSIRASLHFVGSQLFCTNAT
ncbi:unnamed protein product [Brugia timori]|uniref:Secreted protein n=1 Tax=Brugia timori TaxID=42155 RepID=A0A0R3R3F7_9BILA|nr:unnamed protein product [Brugia timori]